MTTLLDDEKRQFTPGTHFWILDEVNQTLECYRHDGAKFVLDAKGKDRDVVRSSLFEGLSIPLSRLRL